MTNSPSNERIAVIDVLRAFALFGIIITHSAGAYLAGPPPSPDFNVFGPLDRFVGQLDDVLVFGKFFSIFAFLFGLSFAIQLQSAQRRATAGGSSFSLRFAWRLLLLFVIGYVHGLFYAGDILAIYAALGLLLIPWQRVPTRAIAIIGVVLVLNLPGLALNLEPVVSPPSAEEAAAAGAGQAAFMARGRQQYEIKRAGTVSELFAINAVEAYATKLRFQVRTGRLWVTFGLFLLGLCAGRMMLFSDTAGHRRFFRRLAWLAGGIAALTTAVSLAYPYRMPARDLAAVLTNFSFSVQQASLATLYLCAITLWFWRRPDRGVLPALAPMGRMGLTTYLMQSVFGIGLFYGIGLGLMGRIGVAASIALGVAFFVAQVYLSQWWLRHYSMGPVEWLWRTLTWFRWQPLARPAAATS
jgi:uncharacterized protein